MRSLPEYAQHLTIQIMSIPGKFSLSLDDRLLNVAAKMHFNFSKVKLETKKDYLAQLKDMESYFTFKFPGLKTGTKRQILDLIYVIKDGRHFEPSICRDIICKILDIQYKSNWRKCKQSKEEEEKLCAKIKLQISQSKFSI